MKKLAIILGMALGSVAAHGQYVPIGAAGFNIVSTAPSGSCTNQAGQFVFNTGHAYACQSGTWVDISSGGSPGGAAGGDLGGTYPNPSVVALNGTNLAALASGFLFNTTATGVPSSVGSTGTGNVVRVTSPSIASPTVTGAFTATGLVTNADIANPFTTVNGQTCTLGSPCTATVPISTGVTGLGTGVATALGNTVNTVGGLQTTLAALTYFDSMPGATVSTQAPAGLVQNLVYLMPFYLPQTATVSNIAYYITAADNTANVYDLGIYGPGCFNGTASIARAGHTGSLAGTVLAPSTGAKVQAFTDGTITIAPGWYCWAATSSAASPVANFGGASAGNHPFPYARGGGTPAGGGATLPSTITAPALSWTAGNGEIFIAMY